MDIWTGLHRVKIWNISGWDNCMKIIQPVPPGRERERLIARNDRHRKSF
jgi:hypothetical protein